MKNKTFIGTCMDLTDQGLGVVKDQGFCYFVKDCLLDEKIEVLVTSIKKNYGYGIVKQYIQTSEHRIKPKCIVAKQCGGCQLQHLDYQKQLDYKTKRVNDCFDYIAKLNVNVQHCLGMEYPYKYRNKVQVPVQIVKGDLKVGFYRNNSNDIVEYEVCEVQTDLQNEIISYIKEILIDMNVAKRIRHILVKQAFSTNEVMVVLIVRECNVNEIEPLVKKCSEYFSEIKSFIVNINNRNDNVILGDKEVLMYGKNSIRDELDGMQFNISSKSFYQINPLQTNVLYKTVITLAGLTGNETVADVYCGVGTIGLFASRYAEKVFGIEIVPEAIEDAKINAKLNNINNIEFICGDAKECTQKLINENISIDVVIVDPPRKGLDVGTIEAVIKMMPKKIVYVSCDPSTLARDCKLFNEKMYNIDYVQPVDMFPQTTHVETVCLLERKG